jgi:hypothetical protein
VLSVLADTPEEAAALTHQHQHRRTRRLRNARVCRWRWLRHQPGQHSQVESRPVKMGEP